MAGKFEIYCDNTRDVGPQIAPPVQPQQPPQLQQPQQPLPKRYIPEALPPHQRFFFDERKLYPMTGGEFTFEELNLQKWRQLQNQLAEKARMEELRRENEELREKIEILTNQLSLLAQKQQCSPDDVPDNLPPSPPSNNRPSIVPQSLQPTDADMSLCQPMNHDVPSVLGGIFSNTFAHDRYSDKFTVPIDQSQYIRENVPTSTPATKRPQVTNGNNRRMSRPSMGGSPTLKLSPITETSRECNSKSSSSSSAMSATPGTVKKALFTVMPVEEPDRPLDPNDPTTYRSLLRFLSDPLDRRSGFFKVSKNLPPIRKGTCFHAGSDTYLVHDELSQEPMMFTAQLLDDDSEDSSIHIKTICLRVDQPANEWLYYICNELHRRLVKQKSKPDIELSLMMANPAIMYNDGSILVDEYFRFVSLQHFFDACQEMNKPFPKSVAAYITLELLQIIRQIHLCEIIHMNINPSNVLITCCPTREDITNVHERTAIVKLIGFDRAMDARLLAPDFKFKDRLNDLVTCQMIDSKPWTYEVDWYGALSCIHKMLFLEDMTVTKANDRWAVDKQFKESLPTKIWAGVFDKLLNIDDLSSTRSLIDEATDELKTWIKANISFVLKEADGLDRVLEDYFKASQKIN